MAPRPAPRWMTALIDQSTQTLPVLPWERAAKRARRLAAVHPAFATSRPCMQGAAADTKFYQVIAAQ
jgi:hypothetical protein